MWTNALLTTLCVFSLKAQQKYSIEKNIKVGVNKHAPTFNGMVFAAKLRSCTNYEEETFASLTKKYKNSSLKMLVVLPKNEPDTLLLNALKGCISPALKKLTDFLYDDELFINLNSGNIKYVEKLGDNFIFHYKNNHINKTERIVFNNGIKKNTKKHQGDSIYKTYKSWDISYARYGTIYHLIAEQDHLYVWQNNSTSVKVFNTKYGQAEMIDFKDVLFQVRSEFFKKYNLKIGKKGLSVGDNLEIELINFRVKDTFYFVDFLVKNPAGRKGIGVSNTILGAVLTNNMKLVHWFLPSRSNIYSQNSKLSDVTNSKFMFEVLPPLKNNNNSRVYLFQACIKDNKPLVKDTVRSLSIPGEIYGKFGSLGDYTDPMFRSITLMNGNVLYWPTTFPLIFNNSKIVYQSKTFDYKPEQFNSTLALKEHKRGIQLVYYVDQPRGIRIENIDHNYQPVSGHTFALPPFTVDKISNMIEHKGFIYFVGERLKEDNLHKDHQLIRFKVD